jgi:hypothetical protein
MKFLKALSLIMIGDIYRQERFSIIRVILNPDNKMTDFAVRLFRLA